MKKHLISLFKLLLAAALIYWLIDTKKITAEPFIKLWATPWLIPFIFTAIFTMIFINNYRWLLLLKGQGINSSVSQTLPLTYIGLFFNLAMPGSVGGDVIKAYYIASDQPGTKLRAATSVVMDRIVGMYAMGLLGLVTIAASPSKILSTPELRTLGVFILAVVVGFTAFFILGFAEGIRAHPLTNKILSKLPGHKIIERLYDAIHDFRHGKRQFLLGVFLSVIVHTLNISALFITARALHFEEATLSSFFFVIPLGLMATAIPISPAGIGVGQAVFLTLFTWYNGSSSQMGPTLITIFQVVQALWGILGAYFYFMRKNPAGVRGMAAPVDGK